MNFDLLFEDYKTLVTYKEQLTVDEYCEKMLKDENEDSQLFLLYLYYKKPKDIPVKYIKDIVDDIIQKLEQPRFFNKKIGYKVRVITKIIMLQGLKQNVLDEANVQLSEIWMKLIKSLNNPFLKDKDGNSIATDKKQYSKILSELSNEIAASFNNLYHSKADMVIRKYEKILVDLWSVVSSIDGVKKDELDGFYSYIEWNNGFDVESLVSYFDQRIYIDDARKFAKLIVTNKLENTLAVYFKQKKRPETIKKLFLTDELMTAFYGVWNRKVLFRFYESRKSDTYSFIDWIEGIKKYNSDENTIRWAETIVKYCELVKYCEETEIIDIDYIKDKISVIDQFYYDYVIPIVEQIKLITVALLDKNIDYVDFLQVIKEYNYFDYDISKRVPVNSIDGDGGVTEHLRSLINSKKYDLERLTYVYFNSVMRVCVDIYDFVEFLYKADYLSVRKVRNDLFADLSFMDTYNLSGRVLEISTGLNNGHSISIDSTSFHTIYNGKNITAYNDNNNVEWRDKVIKASKEWARNNDNIIRALKNKAEISFNLQYYEVNQKIIYACNLNSDSISMEDIEKAQKERIDVYKEWLQKIIDTKQYERPLFKREDQPNQISIEDDPDDEIAVLIIRALHAIIPDTENFRYLFFNLTGKKHQKNGKKRNEPAVCINRFYRRYRHNIVAGGANFDEDVKTLAKEVCVALVNCENITRVKDKIMYYENTCLRTIVPLDEFLSMLFDYLSKLGLDEETLKNEYKEANIYVPIVFDRMISTEASFKQSKDGMFSENYSDYIFENRDNIEFSKDEVYIGNVIGVDKIKKSFILSSVMDAKAADSPWYKLINHINRFRRNLVTEDVVLEDLNVDFSDETLKNKFQQEMHNVFRNRSFTPEECVRFIFYLGKNNPYYLGEREETEVAYLEALKQLLRNNDNKNLQNVYYIVKYSYIAGRCSDEVICDAFMKLGVHEDDLNKIKKDIELYE